MLARVLPTTVILGLLWVTAGVCRAQVPVSVLLDNIRQPANYVGSNLYLETRDEISRGDAEAIFERAQQCTDAVDKALAAGVAASRTITVHVIVNEEAYDGENRQMSLAEVKEMCTRMGALFGRSHLLAEASQMAINASGWPQKLLAGEVSGWSVRAALEAGTSCVKAIEQALRSGAPDSTMIQMLGDDTKSLAEAKEMCVYVRDEAQKIQEKEKAAEEASFAPFTKVLSGDKLALFNQRMRNLKVYGHHGRLLRTPADYKLSDLWCEVGTNRSGAMPMWEVACWHFRGMAQVGDVVRKSGVGEQPPSAAFP